MPLLISPHNLGAAVTSGSVFALAQSIGATGTLAYLGTTGAVLVTGGIALLAGGIVAGIAIGGVKTYGAVQSSYKKAPNE